jgi:membrane-anchored protein YejM (alkaline phosphatase superfamily)
LVLWVPGQQPQQIDYPTSHNQIPATILPLLGVTSPARDYCSEESLFTGARPYRVIGSYDYLALVDANNKLSFPFTTADYFRYIFRDSKDNMLPVSQQQPVLAAKQSQLSEVVAECSRFTLKNNPAVASRESKTPLTTPLPGNRQKKGKGLPINPLAIMLFGKRTS